MIIRSLHCVNFKLFENATFNFGTEVMIIGENFHGKTSVAEGIVYGLYGTSLAGSPNVDGFIRKGTKAMEATVTFEIYGQAHEIVRKKSKTNDVYLDGKKVTQAAIDVLIGDRAYFLAAFVPTYFNALPDKEGRELLVGLIKTPDRKEVIARLSPPEQQLLQYENLLDPDASIKQYRADLKGMEQDALRGEGELKAITERVDRSIPDMRAFDDAELLQVVAELQQMSTGRAEKLARLKSQLDQQRNEYKRVKERTQELPSAPYEVGQPCPICTREIGEDNIDHLLTVHKMKVEEVQLFNEQSKQRMNEIIQKGEEIKAQVLELEQGVEDQTRIDFLLHRKTELEAELNEVKFHNGQVNIMKTEAAADAEKVNQLRVRAIEIESDKENVASIIRAIGNYKVELAEMQIAQLEQHLKRVSLKLFDVIKTTGEIKPVFRVLYDDKEYKTLSLSERIRASLEISSMLNQVSGRMYPIFIDNAESITPFDAPATDQLFTATVIRGASLRVHSEFNEEASA